jgi:DNA-binding transcriptional ArsR family regulator
MIGNRYIAEIAALIGDSARANILFALNSDDQISAGDLAVIADVSNSTASEHLAKLVRGGLVKFVKDGRQKYFMLSDETVSEILNNLESLAQVTRSVSPERHNWDKVHVHARKCMDHVAGKLGCGIAGNLIDCGYVRLDRRGAILSDDGERWIEQFGIETDKLRNSSRRVVSICPDWVENTPHLGGSLGAALMKSFLSRDWIRRDRVEGITRITPKGAHGFRREFGLELRAST